MEVATDTASVPLEQTLAKRPTILRHFRGSTRDVRGIPILEPTATRPHESAD